MRIEYWISFVSNFLMMKYIMLDLKPAASMQMINDLQSSLLMAYCHCDRWEWGYAIQVAQYISILFPCHIGGLKWTQYKTLGGRIMDDVTATSSVIC